MDLSTATIKNRFVGKAPEGGPLRWFIHVLQNFLFKLKQKGFVFPRSRRRILVRGSAPVSQRLVTLAVIIAERLKGFAFFEKRFDRLLSVGKSLKKTVKARLDDSHVSSFPNKERQQTRWENSRLNDSAQQRSFQQVRSIC
jgi:hypothetical protein